MLNCEFSNPLTFQDIVPATSTDFWAYQKISCVADETELIENPESTSTVFYLDKTISYGDFVLILLCVGILALIVFKAITSYFIPSKVNIKK